MWNKDFQNVRRFFMGLAKPFRFVFIFLIITGWVFSGWPQIFNFPPKVQEVYAVTVVVLTSADTSPWDIPSDWNDTNTIEVVGAGGGGGGGGTGGGQGPAGGGGGGAYSLLSNLDLTPGGNATFEIGVGGPGGSGASNGSDGTDTIFNGSGTTCSAQSICAKGGISGKSDANGGAGGAGGVGTNGIGDTRRSGGTGANAGGNTGGGAGGAAGDTAVGGNGSGDTGGDGGGSGAASGGTASNPGTDGTEWASGGSGGGGGGGNKNPGGAGGNDGGGGGGADNGKVGGNGAEGVIVITYEPIVTTTLTQNDFEFFVDNNALTPTDIWGNPDIAENVAVDAVPPSNDPIDKGDHIRLRMNISVTDAQLDAGAEGFILQYARASDCTTGPSWTDVDAAGTGGATWRFFDNGSITDGTALDGAALTLDSSDEEGRYSESDPTGTNPVAVPAGQELEWDWNIEYDGSGAVNEARTYCFRMRKDDPADLDAYNPDSYPRIDIRPSTADQLRHGNFFTEGVERGFFWAD